MKNIWEKVKDFTSPYAADDDYDEEYDDMDDGFEEEESSRFGSRSPRRERRTAVTEETGFESAPQAMDDGVPSFGVGASVPGSFNGHVVGSNLSNKQQLVLLRPETFNDAPIIATNLRQKKAVVLNLENVDKALARRVVDFLSGCTFAVDGSVKKIAHATYLFCPSNMEIAGDLQSLTGETEAYV